MELTRRAHHLHPVIIKIMQFVHRTDVDSKVLVLHALDGQRDVSGPVAEVIAVAAPLELLVLDVVTQQTAAGVLPLDGQLRERLLVLKLVDTLQVDHATWRRDNPDGPAA